MWRSHVNGRSQLTCDVANHAGCGGSTRAVTDGTPNGWGLVNVLGNASEATASYPKIGNETCGDACGRLHTLAVQGCAGRAARGSTPRTVRIFVGTCTK